MTINLTPLETVVAKGGNYAVYKAHITSKDNKQLQRLLDKAFAQGRVRLAEISLQGCPVSWRALDSANCRDQLAAGLKVIDLSRSNCSGQAFEYLNAFPLLERLSFDWCTEMKISGVIPHPSIKELSILGVEVLPDTLRQILRNFPSLVRLDCTINMNDQVPIGLMHRHGLIRPRVTFPNGLIASEGVICTNGMREVALHDLHVTIRKTKETWQVFLLDATKKLIQNDGEVFFHEKCRQFFVTSVKKCHTCGSDDFHPVSLQLDSSLDLHKDFDLLPESCPYDLVRRSSIMYHEKK
jgi:hypothetical protein